MSVPKTSSGKIQRHVCRAKFLEGNLKVLASSILDAPSDDTLAGQPEESFIRKALMAVNEPAARHSLLVLHLQEQAARVLHIAPSQVDPRQPLGALGLDSLMAVELKHEAETSLGVVLPMVDFLQGPSISQLASQILAEMTMPSVTPSAFVVPTEEPTAEHPLSHGQRATWFLHQLAPKSAAYNIASAVRIEGELDISALRRAFQKLVDRHPSLRTTFPLSHEEPVQHVHDEVEVCFQVEDASTWSEAALNERLVEEAHRPFDLEQGPLLRVHPFSRPAQEHILLLVVHHIVADLWSLAVLVHELGMLYPAEQAGTPASLPPLLLQYADHARWQAGMLAGPEGERLWAYWQRQLAGELPALNLPTDRPRPAVQTHCGASQALRLSAELTQGLKALSRARGATLYVTLLAAFQALLHRYTGQEDILVGSPTAGRNWAELAGLVGYFINPVVLRADSSGNPPFAAFLDQVRQTVLEAFAHQHYPFDSLVERLQPERDPSRSPIFQAMFILQQTPLFGEDGLASFALGEAGARMELGGLSLESVALEQRAAQFDLTLVMAEMADGLGVSLQYNSDLFGAATIRRMLEHFRTLLEGIVAQPEQRLSDLPLLTEAEREQLLVAWNDTETNYPQDRCIHELFEAQAEQTPDTVAVAFEDGHLTYRELNRRANQLAYHLGKLGVGLDVLVGICVERSLEMIVGLMGVLKAGGAYVPLDPTYPQERLAFMLADVGVPVLLTQDNLTEGLPDHGARVIRLDADWELIAQECSENPDVEKADESLAYVIYTSGSTGIPKGVMITHCGLRNRLLWMQDAYQLTEDDRVLQKTPFSFDVSGWEFFWPLLTGACLVVARPGGHKDPVYLIETITERSVTTMHFVPSMLQMLVDGQGLEKCASLRRVICSGETLPFDLQGRFFARLDAELHNLYGPTEAAIDVTSWTCEREERLRVVPIGRPVANMQIYLLDAYLRPVPVGVPGELHIGGIGLARGYLNRAELTAEKFIPNPFSREPFSREPGTRLYKTGDLARYLPDGNIEFLGRIDHQVKIRGFRIELGEIEAVLEQHPMVREAVVLVREREPKDPSLGPDKRLVAYVVQRGEGDLGIGDLRRFLRGKLPEYMVPSSFVMLETLPLTASGKVNRRALPASEQAGLDLEDMCLVAPRSPEEEILVGIWIEVLGHGHVGIHDNFFELGGHSLLAARVTSRVRDTFQVELPLHTLFEAPTVACLSECVRMALRSGQKSAALPIAPVSRDSELPLSYAQRRLWFLDQLEPGNPSYNVPTAVRLDGSLDVRVLEQSLNEVVRRHEALRTIFVEVEERPTQVVMPTLRVALPIVDLQALPVPKREAVARELANEEARRPFNLAKGPLLRVVLLKLSEEEHVVLLNLHHIVSDGWSIGVLIREVTTLYENFVAGKPSPLADLSVQYVDYAVWEQERLQREVLDRDFSYWRERLSGGSFVLELPGDRPRPPVQSFRGACQSFVLPESLATALKALSRREGVTLFMTLLAAFKTLLYRYTGQDNIVVGSPIANRDRRELEPLIGFLVNTLVLRTDLSGEPSFRELIRRVREVTLGAYAHKDLPFELLVEKLQPERDLSRSPLFQLMFVLQNAPTEALELPGLSASILEIDSKTAKFDLTLFIEEAERGLRGMVEYNTDLFDATTIARMIGHYQIMLEGIVADPEQRICDLPLLTKAEQHQLLWEWNDTRTEYPSNACIDELFEVRVRRTPDAVAVVLGDQYLTYRELSRRANRLAHHLRGLGIEPETLVGVCVERSLEMVVGLLGVLKAGGAYVPLDPAYPEKRLAFMLQDTRASVLLTQQRLVERLPAHEARVLCLDTHWETIGRAPARAPRSKATSDNLAYVIYTSGSTGRPKGVAIRHRSAVALICWAGDVFDTAILTGVLASTSICFDLSVFELFVTLSHGGTVILAETALHLPALPAAEAVTLINTVPSAMRELLHVEGVPSSVCVVNLAGEPLPTDLVRQVYQRGAIQEVFDLYGPSEDTTYSTYALRGTTGPATIGRPIANTQIYLLDAHLNPVPIGVPGELYVGGDGLAREYLNRPALTTDKFIPNPFSKEPGTRLYKTGDLARYLPDGNIEFLGRIDHQVKVRGFRIELGEIEAVLRQHPAVQDAAALVREDTPGDKRVVAYFVSDQEPTPSNSDLRRFLWEQLPDYMMPSAFILLETMPLTPSGKIDRRALSVPPRGRVGLDNVFVAPRTSTEEVVASTWADVLGVEQVGIYDDFFALGGHSLLATQVMSRLRVVFQIELPLRAFFEEPTVVAVSSALDRTRQADSDDRKPAIKRVSRDQYRRKISRASRSIE